MEGKTIRKIAYLSLAVITAAWAALTGNALRSVLSNRLVTFPGHAARVFDVVPSPDCKALASVAEDGTISVWDVAARRARNTLGSGPRSSPLAFSPDGKILASAGHKHNTITLWDVASANDPLILKGHHGGVCCLEFSPDGKTIASGGLDKTVKLWDVATGREKATFVGHQGSVYGVTFCPDGRTLASCGSSRSIKLWDIPEIKERSTLVEVVGGHGLDSVKCVAFSPDGKMLASGNNDTEVELWDVASGEKRFTMGKYEDETYIESVAFSSDGQVVAASDLADNVKLWSVSTGKIIACYSADPPPPCYPRLVCTLLDWFPSMFERHRDDFVIRSLRFTPDGKLLAFGSEWNYSNQVKMRELPGR
jgi:WD40 repeat protein